MNLINTFIGVPLGWIMWFCYQLTNSYVLSIVLLTLISKVILLPLSIAVQKNSIKMIRLQPELNRITVQHYGDRDTIADKTMALYKRESYSPALGIVPLLIQILLVLGMIGVVYHPIQHLLHVSAPACDVLVQAAEQLTGLPHMEAGGQLLAIRAMTDPANYNGFMQCADLIPDTDVAAVIESARQLDMSFLGLDLTLVPHLFPVTLMTMVPLASCLSALLLCVLQNRENVLQREQSLLSQWGVTLFTVALSTYFAFVVPAGVGVYWVVSNLFALGLLYLLNLMYPPKKEIDYEALEESKKLLKARKDAKADAVRRLKPYRKRERADYRRFFRGGEQKELVIYSESSGFYKYYSGMIDYIMKNSDIVIHYVTSDPDDQTFAMEGPKFHVYYIGELRLIPLMMKIDADMVMMTVPDLELFHLKRSIVRKDIEYVYVEHGIGSDNLLGRPHSLDHYDTIFNAGPHHTAEDRALEELYGIKPRRLVKVGYSLIDEMTEAWAAHPKKDPSDKKTVMIAPSWQADNIMDSCIHQLLEQLLPLDLRLIVRPHPQYVRLYPDRVEALIRRYEDQLGPDFEIQTDFSSNETVYSSDLLITDWSNVALEFCFSTFKPVLYINTPMKVMNPDYQKIDVIPIDIWIRSEVGAQLDLDALERTGETVLELLSKPEEYSASIRQVKEKAIYNVGRAAEAAGRYVISRLRPQQKEK